MAIACGGTGGHFYPGLSVARTLKSDGGEVMLLLSGKHVNAQSDEAAKFDVPSVEIPAAQRPSNPLSCPGFLLTLLKGFVKARRVMRDFRPDAFLAMGSFASVPSAAAAVFSGIPLFLHDGNARIGRANLFLSRWATHLAGAFPPVNDDRIQCEWSVTGMPLRPELMDRSLSKPEAMAEINRSYGVEWKPNSPTLLVFGGSQGARVFNDVLPQALIARNDARLQVVHITGANVDPSDMYASANFAALTIERAIDMSVLFQAADVVVCRSGGSTCAELAAFGKRAILVPYPYAADDHQTDNAKWYASTGAGTILSNDDCDVPTMSGIFDEWLRNPATFTQPGLEGKKNATPNATGKLLRKINDYELRITNC